MLLPDDEVNIVNSHGLVAARTAADRCPAACSTRCLKPDRRCKRWILLCSDITKVRASPLLAQGQRLGACAIKHKHFVASRAFSSEPLLPA